MRNVDAILGLILHLRRQPLENSIHYSAFITSVILWWTGKNSTTQYLAKLVFLIFFFKQTMFLRLNRFENKKQLRI